MVHLQGACLVIAAMSSHGYVNCIFLLHPQQVICFVVWVVRSAAEESQSDHNMLAPQRNGVATFSDGLPALSDTGTEILREGTEKDENSFLHGPGSGDLENQRMVANSSNYLKAHGSGKDMERALAHQAQLIGRYAEEEKAQREWEEKFRENNSSTLVCLVVSLVKCCYAVDLSQFSYDT